MKNRAASSSARGSWIALAAIILFVVIIRLRFLPIPLERDEGEFAYVGQLMLQGIAPYKLAYVIKLPGTAAVYALGMALFGQTAPGIHLVLLLANVGAIVLLFLLAKKWFDSGVGVVAAATYALMSLSWCSDGYAAHATQFLVPAVLGGILLLGRGLVSGRLGTIFWSGMLFGLAFLLKQPGLLFAAFGGFWVVAHEWPDWPAHRSASMKKAAAFAAGTVLPFLALCVALADAGVFDRFWYWSFTVANGGWTSPATAWWNLVQYGKWVWSTRELLFWGLAGATLLAAWWLPPVRPVRGPFLAFCAISIAAPSLGLRFNTHYFIMALPAAGLLLGVGVGEASRVLKSRTGSGWISCLPGAFFAVLCGAFLWANSTYLFLDPVEIVSKRIYDHNPFVEAVAVADYIRTNSSPDAKIAVLGSEPEIYFLSHRHSVTGHLSTYLLTAGRPWSRSMQEEMSREIIAGQPEYIVLVKNTFSWLKSPDPGDPLLANLTPFIRQGYRAVGVVVCHSGVGDPAYYWGEALRADRTRTSRPRRMPFTSIESKIRPRPKTDSRRPSTAGDSAGRWKRGRCRETP